MSIIDPRVDLCDAYRRGSDVDQKFIASLAQYLGSFLKENATIIEVLDDDPARSDLKSAHQMVCFTFNNKNFSCFLSLISFGKVEVMLTSSLLFFCILGFGISVENQCC